ncbi:SF3a splicing factor complex subunit [Arachnomyces sp. PD_36]|nr:SF3a splicing factor complex subunit [Arachnomyces sp. PD_36]
MAVSGTNGDVATPTGLPDEVSKPPEGVVLPPKDIRAIVEKTAGYVARNGLVFEDRVREKEKHNPKFSFLSTGDAYAPFYQWRLNEIREGRGTAVSAGRAGEPAAEPEPEKPKGPPEPPEFHFSARIPTINALDLEVVKLTALFVAKRGKSFMTALSQRETRNYQFDFLRPQHSLYQFFTRLVDQYTELLQVDGEDEVKAQAKRLAKLELNVKDKFHMLGRAKQRSEWAKYQEQQKQKKEEQDEQEKVAYAQIDWHDFVVVETVEFTEADDQAELPPPTSLNDLQSASLEQKAMMSLHPQGLRIEEAMPTEEETTYYNAYPPEQFQPTPTQLPQRTASTATDFTPQATPPAATPAREEDEEERLIRERAEAREQAHAAQAAAKAGATAHPGQQPMRIRSDYVPRAQAKRLGATTAATGLCPNCHQQIPLSEMEHHMRIELLDPRWKEQRAKAESRHATTNLSTTEVANNLKRLASQRSDVFDANIAGGMDQQGATVAAAAAAAADGADADEESRRKRLATGAGIGVPSYDAAEAQRNTAPQAQSMNIEDQIRHIREKYQQ